MEEELHAIREIRLGYWISRGKMARCDEKARGRPPTVEGHRSSRNSPPRFHSLVITFFFSLHRTFLPHFLLLLLLVIATRTISLEERISRELYIIAFQ